jgi:thiol-disulfide isomerase/thioredoxin
MVGAQTKFPSQHFPESTEDDLLTQGTTMKLLFAILITSLVLSLSPTAQAKRVPNLEFKDRAGTTHKLSDLRGSMVVLNFWATWCGPCRQELPLLSMLSQQYSGRNVRFIAASANEDKDRAKVDEFLKNNPLAFDVWLGADLDMLDRVSLGNVLPATLILDDQGEIVARIMGQAHEEDLTAALNWLLNGKSGPPPPSSVKRY